MYRKYSTGVPSDESLHGMIYFTEQEKKALMPVESGMLKRLKDLIKADQVKITKEEVDWKDIVESLCKKNKKWKATVVPLSQNFSIDDIKDNDGCDSTLYSSPMLLPQ